MPTLQHNYVDKKTILDPVLTPQTYQLPTAFDVTQEKLTPGFSNLIPNEDPHPLQKVNFQYNHSNFSRNIFVLEIKKDWYLAK